MGACRTWLFQVTPPSVNYQVQQVAGEPPTPLARKASMTWASRLKRPNTRRPRPGCRRGCLTDESKGQRFNSVSTGRAHTTVAGIPGAVWRERRTLRREESGVSAFMAPCRSDSGVLHSGRVIQQRAAVAGPA